MLRLSRRPFNPRGRVSLRLNSRQFIGYLLIIFCGQQAIAEILNSSTSFIRIRLGDNVRGNTNTVIYTPQIPADMGGLIGVTAQHEAISTNFISGGSGVFEVRVVTDLNARNGLAQLEGRFSYDSSQPMACITAATCGATTIPFDRISWNLRDSDTHTAVTQFDNTADQVTQIQLDTNPATNGTNTRHRNYFQYVFDNMELLPAGTYEGVISINGTGSF